MALSAEVERILEDLQSQFGDKEITDADAELLYGGKASTFSKLCQRDRLSYALVLTAINRDEWEAAYRKLVLEYNSLAKNHEQAVATIQRMGNRKQRRHPWEGR